MYFNCFIVQRGAGCLAARAGGVRRLRLGALRAVVRAGAKRYALSATREGASPHSCSRR